MSSLLMLNYASGPVNTAPATGGGGGKPPKSSTAPAQGDLPEVTVTATRPKPFDWQQLANNWWPGYSFGTCMYQGFIGGGCGAGSWILATLGTLPIAAGKLTKAGQAIFKTAHYADRLIAEGVDVASAETAIANEIAAMQDSLSVGAPFSGQLTVDGVLLEYRAYPLPEGPVNVGTIFPVGP